MTDQKQKEFSQLLALNKNVVWSIVNDYFSQEADKEDLFQDIAMSAWATYHLFRGDCKFSTWLYGIGIRKAVEKVKQISSQIKTVAFDNVLFEVVDKGAWTTDEVSLKDHKDLYYKSVSRLSNPELKFVVMYAEGYSYEEMAVILNTKPENLRMRMNRIKQRLRKHLLYATSH